MTTTSSYDHTAPGTHDAHRAHRAHGGTFAHFAPIPAPPLTPAIPRTLGSRLGPGEDFPDDLTGLVLVDLQVLHSRVTRQLDHDWLTDPDGPHPATLDRHQDLLAELDARDTA